MSAQLRRGLMEDLRMRLADRDVVAGDHRRKVMPEPQVREKAMHSRRTATRRQGHGHARALQVLQQWAYTGNQLDVFDFALKQQILRATVHLNLLMVELAQKVSKDFLPFDTLTYKVEIRVAQ